MNRLIVIGWIGTQRCYLNVSREEAVRRYTKQYGEAPDSDMIREFEFNDEFGAYDVYAVEV